jgi:branched-chain amino acid transport system permease protein
MDIQLTVVLSLLIAGISRAMIYFLLAAGLTLIFGVMDVINFAHGAFYMLGVFFCYTIIVGMDFGLGVAFLFVCFLLAVIGALTEYSLFRRIFRGEHVMQLLLSFGVVYIISDVVRMGWGVTPKSIGMPPLFRGIFNVQNVIMTKYSLFIVGITIFIALAMFLILYRTKMGAILRACAIDHEMTRCRGINVSRVFLLVFMAGVGLAGVAAAAAAPMVTANLGMDAQMIIVAFSVVIIGGAGSIGGAFVAALIIGIVESLGILILPQFAEAFMYLVVVVCLLFRPSGLFGKTTG